MNISREIKKQEALRRMKALGIFPGTVKQFEEQDLVSYSIGPFGACYWLDDKMKKRVEEIEEEYGILVYHMIPNRLVFGLCESYLYVSDHEEEWEMDRIDTRNKEPVAYVYNVDEPCFSEFGHIGVQLTPAAGLKRVW